MDLFTEFREMVFLVVATLLAALLAATKNYITKNLEIFYNYLIRSRFTPARLSYQEKKAMQEGVKAGLKEVKKAIYASNIYLLSIAKNGTDTFRQHIIEDDKCNLDGKEVASFDDFINELVKKKSLIFENTDIKTDNVAKQAFLNVLRSLGYKSVNFILIDEKKLAFVLIVYRDNKVTSESDVDYLCTALSSYRDPIRTLYLK